MMGFTSGPVLSGKYLICRGNVVHDVLSDSTVTKIAFIKHRLEDDIAATTTFPGHETSHWSWSYRKVGDLSGRSDEEITHYLSRLVTEGEKDSFLIISVGEFYVQFMIGALTGTEGPLLWCEAVSNVSIPELNISDQVASQMRSLGFEDPSTDVWETGLGSPNFARIFSYPDEVELGEIARTALFILKDIYGCQFHSKLQFDLLLEKRTFPGAAEAVAAGAAIRGEVPCVIYRAERACLHYGDELTDRNSDGVFSSFATDTDSKDSSPQLLHIRLDRHWLNIHVGPFESPQMSFSGRCCHSPDGQFILGWGDYGEWRGDYEAHGHASGFVLLNTCGKVLHLVAFESATFGMNQPRYGKVSARGVFVLGDDQGTFGTSAGLFYAFDPGEGTMFCHRFRAFVTDTGVSEDGRFGVCSTAASPDNPEDSVVVCVFDLEHNSLLAKFKPIVGVLKRRPLEYRFDSEENTICIIYDDQLEHHYSFGGRFLDEARWETDRLYIAQTDRYGYSLLEIALERLQKLDSSHLEAYVEIVALLARSIDIGVSENTQARIHRVMGEIYHRCGDDRRALEHLEIALRLNPNVGVKRLAQRLRNPMSEVESTSW